MIINKTSWKQLKKPKPPLKKNVEASYQAHISRYKPQNRQHTVMRTEARTLDPENTVFKHEEEDNSHRYERKMFKIITDKTNLKEIGF